MTQESLTKRKKMKLRSIALAGLLGAGLLMTSGCNEDDVLDAVGDLLQQNVVYTVNGTGGDVTFTVGSESTLVADKAFNADLLTGSDSYAVSYTPNNGLIPVSFDEGSTYIYAATTCTSAGQLNHEVNTNKVNIINLSNTEIVPGDTTTILITQADGTTQHEISETVTGCSVIGTPSLNNVVIEDGMNIKVIVNNALTQEYTVTGIDPDLIALGNTLKVDIIIFEDNTLGVVPMATYDDLVVVGTSYDPGT